MILLIFQLYRIRPKKLLLYIQYRQTIEANLFLCPTQKCLPVSSLSIKLTTANPAQDKRRGQLWWL